MKIISFRAKSEQAEEPPTLEIAGRVLPVIVRRHPQAKGYKLRYDAVKAELRLTMPVRGRLRAALDDGRAVTPDLFSRLLDQEMAALRRDFFTDRLEDAAGLFADMVLSPHLVEFLTLPAYELIAGNRSEPRLRAAS